MNEKKRRKGTIMRRVNWSIVGVVLAMAAQGCGLYPYRCEDYSECTPEVAACTGECVPLPPLDFNGPALLWIGKESAAPECPGRAPRRVYEGYADLDASNQCPACTCSEPACVLPEGVTASSSPTCLGPTFTAFDAPANWDGVCASPTTVDALSSVLIAPTTVRPCAPVVEEPPQNNFPPSSWGTYARACAGEAIPNVCGDPGLTCLPTAEPPPPGFRQCIMYLGAGDPECPEDFPEEHQLYGDLEDTRGCTACECVQAAPSECTASMSIYQAQGCGSWIFSSMITDQPSCFPVPPGVSLGGMDAAWITNDPGSCVAVGGAPVGEAKPIEPRTFCCQPLPG
ncbi:MAG TPA: hypothetical protein VLS89_19805 [Candidatus Nanopelagicales bacterium]|nr:hypothetical protein [Candidatus Nanopelagicales bacterium]